MLPSLPHGVLPPHALALPPPNALRHPGLLRLRGGGVVEDWVPPAILLLPAGSRLLLAINLAVFALGAAFPQHAYVGAAAQIEGFGLQPAALLREPREILRAVTHTLVHSSLLHVLVNMMSLVAVGRRLEKLLGTAPFLGMCAQLLAAYVGVLVVGSVVAIKTKSVGRAMQARMVGFSGILFALFTVDSLAQPKGAQVTVNGVTMDAVWYPWAALVIQSLLFPQASFIGHAAGIAAGHLYSKNSLAWCDFPPSLLKRIEKALGGWRGFEKGRGVSLVRR